MIRIIVLALLFISASCAGEVPPMERAFRFLVVGEDDKPVDGIPLGWIFSIEDGKNDFGGRMLKEVERKISVSGNGGIVEVPKYKFSHFQVMISDDEIKKSHDWMVDSKLSSQSFRWNVYYLDTPHGTTLGPSTEGFDGVFKVMSKKGIAPTLRYQTRHDEVPGDGTPTPLNILGGRSAKVERPEQTDVVITIRRPNQEMLPPGSNQVAKPLRVPWTIEGKTVRFAHFAADTDLSTDYRRRTWTDRIDVEPTNVGLDRGYDFIVLWTLLPGEKPTVFPLRLSLTPSLGSRKLGRLVYYVNVEVGIPASPGTRFHHEFRSNYWGGIAREIEFSQHAKLIEPMRAEALKHQFPADLVTIPVLRYDTFPPLPSDQPRDPYPWPVLLPPPAP